MEMLFQAWPIWRFSNVSSTAAVVADLGETA
jgi:hypothetical protein